MRVLIVVNPYATSVTARNRVVVTKALRDGNEVTLVETNRRGHATRLAADAGMACLACREEQISDEQFAAGKTPSTYVVMARQRSELEPLAAFDRWHTPPVNESIAVWTDDFSNLVEVLKW